MNTLEARIQSSRYCSGKFVPNAARCCVRKAPWMEGIQLSNFLATHKYVLKWDSSMGLVTYNVVLTGPESPFCPARDSSPCVRDFYSESRSVTAGRSSKFSLVLWKYDNVCSLLPSRLPASLIWRILSALHLSQRSVWRPWFYFQQVPQWMTLSQRKKIEWAERPFQSCRPSRVIPAYTS